MCAYKWYGHIISWSRYHFAIERDSELVCSRERERKWRMDGRKALLINIFTFLCEVVNTEAIANGTSTQSPILSLNASLSLPLPLLLVMNINWLELRKKALHNHTISLNVHREPLFCLWLSNSCECTHLCSNSMPHTNTHTHFSTASISIWSQ